MFDRFEVAIAEKVSIELFNLKIPSVTPPAKLNKGYAIHHNLKLRESPNISPANATPSPEAGEKTLKCLS